MLFILCIRLCTECNGLWLSQQGHVPLVSILCSPGIRSRHWQQMSEIVGFDLTPDSSTKLRNVLKHNLAPYLEQFESISTVATKVSDRKKKTLAFISVHNLCKITDL